MGGEDRSLGGCPMSSVRTGAWIATDLQMGFLSEIDASNVEILHHNVRTDTFPASSFDLIHTRACARWHTSPSVDLLQRMVTWLAPGGWLLFEEPDFGMWIGDADPAWAASPPRPLQSPSRTWHSPRVDLCSARFTSSASQMLVQTPRSTSSKPALILPSSTSSVRPLSPFRRCKLGPSALLLRQTALTDRLSDS